MILAFRPVDYEDDTGLFILRRVITFNYLKNKMILVLVVSMIVRKLRKIDKEILRQNLRMFDFVLMPLQVIKNNRQNNSRAPLRVHVSQADGRLL